MELISGKKCIIKAVEIWAEIALYMSRGSGT